MLPPNVPLLAFATVTFVESALLTVKLPTQLAIVVGVPVNVFVDPAATLPLVALIANVGVYFFIFHVTLHALANLYPALAVHV